MPVPETPVGIWVTVILTGVDSEVLREKIPLTLPLLSDFLSGLFVQTMLADGCKRHLTASPFAGRLSEKYSMCDIAL